MFAPDCDVARRTSRRHQYSVISGAAPVETLNAEDEVFSIKLDYAGPEAPHCLRPESQRP